MSRYIDADAVEYHEDDAVYRWEIDAMPTADVPQRQSGRVADGRRSNTNYFNS